jgi:hypothetical protein
MTQITTIGLDIAKSVCPAKMPPSVDEAICAICHFDRLATRLASKWTRPPT